MAIYSKNPTKHSSLHLDENVNFVPLKGLFTELTWKRTALVEIKCVSSLCGAVQGLGLGIFSGSWRISLAIGSFCGEGAQEPPAMGPKVLRN